MPTKTRPKPDLSNRRGYALEKIRIAFKENRGTRLTAEDVDALMNDTAIRDVVNGTYDEDEINAD